MFSPGLKRGDLGRLDLSRTEQKSLYVAGVFFVLTLVFSAFSVVSTILSNVSLSGSTEKAIVAGLGVATALVVGLLGYSIEGKAAYAREKGSHLVSAARLLLLEAVFAGAICLATTVAVALVPLEHTYLTALAGATLCVAGLFGCLFGTLFRVRTAKRAALGGLMSQAQRTVAEREPLAVLHRK
jgi:hypothetical protein